MSPGPGQIFQDPSGTFALYVRTEKRPGKDHPEHLFIFTKDRLLFQRWTDALPEDYELVNDTAGRGEAKMMQLQVEALQYEREALSNCLKAAVAMLDDRAAEELRGLYRVAMEKAEFVSA